MRILDPTSLLSAVDISALNDTRRRRATYWYASILVPVEVWHGDLYCGKESSAPRQNTRLATGEQSLLNL